MEHLPVTAIQSTRGQHRHEIGPQGRGAAQRLVAPPPRDGGMVPREQDRGHLTPPPHPWPGKNRAFKQAGHGPGAGAERVIWR